MGGKWISVSISFSAFLINAKFSFVFAYNTSFLSLILIILFVISYLSKMSIPLFVDLSLTMQLLGFPSSCF